jgi:hypothetical protein
MQTEAITRSRFVDRARKFAIEAHKGQKYGDQAYEFHLEHVESVMLRFGHFDEDLLADSWLHDVCEDCDQAYKSRMDVQFPAIVVETVKAVSHEPGKNRKGAQCPHLCKDPRGMADRIANGEHSQKTNSEMFEMYRKEYPGFREALHQPGIEDATWQHLDSLFG